MCQGDVGVFAGVSLPEVEFAYEVAGVVEHVVDGSGEAEQVLAVQWRGPCLSQCVDDLGADLVAFVFDVVDVFPGFLDAGVAFDGVKGDGYAFASGGGLFPEQAVNWDFAREKIEQEGRPIRVLNLFAYTGAASVACAKSGASVCHVDAAKGMVVWAKENAKVSGLADAPIRWIVDDCAKFVEREIRRGKTYDAIIMDPPSYGRGPGGEVWKLEDNLFPFVKLCSQVLSDKPLFVIINSYTTGLAPSVLGYMLHLLVAEKYGGRVTWDELGLPVTETGLALPCGATGRWCSE